MEGAPQPEEARSHRARMWWAALSVLGYATLLWWVTEMRMRPPLP